jgi:hypothetical protein
VDYKDWIGRERRLRRKILMDSAVIREKGICRICKECGEICLCHELTCPNCNCKDIIEDKFDNIKAEILNGNRIRCKFRFEKLT